MSFKRNNWIFILIFVISLALVFSEEQLFQILKASKPVSNEIVIGFSNHPSWWPWMVAEEEKIFAANNLNAKLKWYDNYSDSIRDFRLGNLDANSELIVGKAEIQNLENSKKVTVLINNYSRGEDQLIVKPGINKIEDLAGKRVLAESNDVLNLFLKNNRLLKNKLDIQILETGLASSAFVTDENIDAIISYPPYSDIALRIKGSKAIASSADFPEEIARMLVVHNDLANQSPELIEKLKESWFESLDYIYENPIKAKIVMANKLNLEGDQVVQAREAVKLIGKKGNSLFLTKHN